MFYLQDSKDDDKEKEKDKKDSKEEKGEKEEKDKKEKDKDDKEDRKKDKDKDEKKKEKRKYMTVNPDLLLSCIYFDQNHCGYVLDKDVEEILHSIGLHLSRAQVRSYFT